MGRHLTISSSWDRDKIVYESIDFTRIRSLTVFGKWMSFFVSDKMRFLRVLDLEDTLGVTNDDLEQIIKLLRRLKFLSLRGCKEITSLPDSLGEMKQLQTLDVKHTSIVTLPVNITKLQRLHYINAGRNTMPSNGETKDTTIVAAAIPPEDDVGSWVPSPPTTATTPLPDHDNGALGRRRRTRAHDLVSTWLSNVNKLGKRQFEIKNGGVQFVPAAVEGVGKLTALHTLGVINVRGSGANLIFREVKKLTQLRKLRLSGINRKNWQDMWCAISGHGYLASLLVHLDCNKKRQQDLYCLDDISEPPTTLKSFKMYGGKIQVSLAWIKKLDNLKKAHLEDLELTVSTQEHIESLMALPSAKILQIECGNYRCDIEFLTGWKFVEVLVVHCSTTEASLEISSLNCLSGLKEVRLKGSYSEAVKQHLQQELDDKFSPSTRPELKLDPQ
uniref:Uncharacterized protein n=1 Tax=Avena sativa TaxID=4498 RepID=A0ACD5WKU5_AVESA